MDTKNEDFLKKRLIELANASYQSNKPIYSYFLNINEQNILIGHVNEMPPVHYQLIGGHEFSERCLAAFLPLDFITDILPPIRIIKVFPVNMKFSDDITHRDCLGAIMSLGIERNMTGDILIDQSKIAYIFVMDKVADYILEHLTKIKNTIVRTEIIEKADFNYQAAYEEVIGTVASIRLDKIASLSFKIPRNSVIKYIEGGLVFINGKNVTSNGYTLQDNDIISIRGLGRCIYEGSNSISKKGRLIVKIKKYI